MTVFGPDAHARLARRHAIDDKITAAAWLAFQRDLDALEPGADTWDAEQALDARLADMRSRPNEDPAPEMTDEEVRAVLDQIESASAEWRRKAVAAIWPEE